MKVAIIGGSISGLMHGVMLKHHGHTVHILEKTTRDLEGQGAGISTALQVAAFLKDHDRTGRPIALDSNGIRVFDPQSNLKDHYHTPLRMCTWDAIYYRLRANFDGLATKYNPLPPADLPTDGEVTYDVGKEVVTLVNNGAGKPIEVVYIDRRKEGKEQSSITVDFVIGADGPSSTVKKLVAPAAPPRQYAGYVAWRGIVAETSVPKTTRDTLFGSFTFHTATDEYVVVYPVPGKNGSLEEGERALNFVWYVWETEDNLKDILMDSDGHTHRWSVPSGKLRKDVWTKQKAHGIKTHTKEFADMLRAMESPFVQVITDCDPPSAPGPSFQHGRVFLVGDAQGTLRPHTGFALNQAAYHCAEIEKRLPQIESALVTKAGETPENQDHLDGWNQSVLEFHHVQQLRGKAIGLWYLQSKLRWLPSLLQWKVAEFVLTLKHKWRNLFAK